MSIDECLFLEVFKFLYIHSKRVARKRHLIIQLLSCHETNLTPVDHSLDSNYLNLLAVL